MVNATVEIAALYSSIEDLQSQIDAVGKGADIMWVLLTAALVFFMQCGFCMLEAGTVRSKNTVNILFKNLVDGGISAISFWLIGYGFAFGSTQGGFIGRTKFGLSGDTFDLNDNVSFEYHSFFFQWTFAAAASTIVSGSVAERCKLEAYFIYASFLCCWTYPVIVHWAWGEGWMSAFGPHPDIYLLRGRDSNNFVDFAGSGVVHTVGGITGLVAATIIGPRTGRFDKDGNVVEFASHNATLIALGTLILWLGWYGFNPGSTLCIVGDCSEVAALVAVNTTIGGASGLVTSILFIITTGQKYDIGLVANGLLAGLVSVTAPCSVVDVWGAWLIGTAGALVYICGSTALKKLQIDDPLDASPLHAGCGIWGVISVGIFGNDGLAGVAGYLGSANGHHPFKDGEQFGVQLIGILCIVLWSAGFAAMLFFGIKFTIGLRVDAETENIGLDTSEHGQKAYNIHHTGPDGVEMVSDPYADKGAGEA